MAAVDAVPALNGLSLLFGLPEHKVALPGGSRASQTDFWFLGVTQGSTVSVAVEGKVKEPFGPTVQEWRGQDHADSGKSRRLAALREILGISVDADIGSVRYQLLHRSASSVLEAKRFHAKAALMLVHSFGGSTNFDQYREFTALFGEEHRSTGIFQATQLSDVPLYLGWVSGEAQWLTA